MKHLSKERRKIAREIRDSHTYLFLDFDGTLTPIRRHPGKVRLGKRIYEILQKLAGTRDVDIAIISGRSLKEIKRLVGVKNIIYVGNHGLEVYGAGADFKLAEAVKGRRTITALSRKLRQELRFFRGVIVEDKGLTLSVHFRMAKEKDIQKIVQAFEKVVRPYKKEGKVKVTGGKKVWEIRPPVEWDKGRMIKRLLKEKRQRLKKRVIPFCMGDDRTDEDAFGRLGNDGYTVKITKNPGEASTARYYLRNVREVSMFLRDIYLLRKGE